MKKFAIRYKLRSLVIAKDLFCERAHGPTVHHHASLAWTIVRSLRVNGSWVIIGSGLQHIFRDLHSLAVRLHQVK
jgi:hypothetical protein